MMHFELLGFHCGIVLWALALVVVYGRLVMGCNSIVCMDSGSCISLNQTRFIFGSSRHTSSIG